MPTQPATVYVIDDDAGVRDSIVALAEVHRIPVQTFGFAEDFLAIVTPTMAGCIVTDIHFENGMSGIEMQRVLKSRNCQLPVVVISAYATIAKTVAAMGAGAVTLLEKTSPPEELWAAIAKALEKDAAAQTDRVRITDLLRKFRLLRLEEVKVLSRVINGVLNKVIATDLNISLRTVESRRATILKKIEVASVAELVKQYSVLEAAYARPPEELLNPQPGADGEGSAF